MNMNLKLTYLTIILVLSILVSRAQIDWQSSDWAYGCDFNGEYITKVQTNAGNCGPACLSTPKCTHFTWTTLNGGTCYLKSGKVKKSDAISTEDNSMICSLSTNPNSYWQVSEYLETDHYFLVSPFQNSYSCEFKNGKVQSIFYIVHQYDTNQTLLFDSNSKIFVILDSNTAQYSDNVTYGFEIFNYGSWISNPPNFNCSSQSISTSSSTTSSIRTTTIIEETSTSTSTSTPVTETNNVSIKTFQTTKAPLTTTSPVQISSLLPVSFATTPIPTTTEETTTTFLSSTDKSLASTSTIPATVHLTTTTHVPITSTVSSTTTQIPTTKKETTTVPTSSTDTSLASTSTEPVFFTTTTTEETTTIFLSSTDKSLASTSTIPTTQIQTTTPLTTTFPVQISSTLPVSFATTPIPTTIVESTTFPLTTTDKSSAFSTTIISKPIKTRTSPLTTAATSFKISTTETVSIRTSLIPTTTETTTIVPTTTEFASSLSSDPTTLPTTPIQTTTAEITIVPTTSIFTPSPSKVYTTSAASHLYISYGCVIFNVAGDIYFNITNDSAEKCIIKCLNSSSKYNFFITSFFEGHGFFCDCFLDNSYDTVIVNPLLCNQNCNQTCCDKKTKNTLNPTKCEKCGSSNGKYGNKYTIKNEIPSTTTQEIITAHPTTSSTSMETTHFTTRTEFTTNKTTTISTSSQPKSTSIQTTKIRTTTILDTTIVLTTKISTTSTFRSSASSSSLETTTIPNTTLIPITAESTTKILTTFTNINSSPDTSTVLTTPIRTTSIATSYSSRISTTSSASHSYISYGCVIFDVAGDIYFNITNDSAEKCVKECLIRNSSFQFFITSYFEGQDYFCDCFLDNSYDTVIVNPLLCNQNCNQTCCDKKTKNTLNPTKCEKCGSSNGKYGNKYTIKNEIPSTTTQEIITAHPTTSSPSTETKSVLTTIYTTPATSVTSSTTASSSYISYGCVIFDVAGDIYFNITNNSAEKCVKECLIKDKNFQSFITSYFEGQDYFCDCFLDNLHDTVIVNSLLCNQNCNQTCCDKETKSTVKQAKCEKCGSSNGKYGNKYTIKNEISSTTSSTNIIRTEHPSKHSTIF